MERYLAQDTEQQRLSVMLLTGFGALALVLAIVGIYGVLSYAVSRRTQEIGIRLALGATRADVLRLVVGQGVILTIVGLAIGLAGSYAAGRVLAAMLFQISPRDPATFGVLAALLGGVAVLASAVPGWRATRIDPITALRSE
jgi:putative ABC transport system permease protein